MYELTIDEEPGNHWSIAYSVIKNELVDQELDVKGLVQFVFSFAFYSQFQTYQNKNVSYNTINYYFCYIKT